MKEKSNLVVILSIMGLLLLIILPPVFRSLFPKQEKEEVNNLSFLKCQRDVFSERLNVTTSFLYNNESFKKATITYTLYPDSSNMVDDNTIEYSAMSELGTFLQSTAEIKEIEEQTVVSFNDTLVEQGDSVLQNYANDIFSQKKHFESFGFTCSIMES